MADPPLSAHCCSVRQIPVLPSVDDPLHPSFSNLTMLKRLRKRPPLLVLPILTLVVFTSVSPPIWVDGWMESADTRKVMGRSLIHDSSMVIPEIIVILICACVPCNYWMSQVFFHTSLAKPDTRNRIQNKQGL